MLTNNEKEILRTIIKDCKKANIPRSTTFEFLKWYCLSITLVII